MVEAKHVKNLTSESEKLLNLLTSMHDQIPVLVSLKFFCLLNW